MKRGFTIVELMIVVAVIAVLSSIAVLGANAMLNEAKTADRETNTKIIKAALEKYYTENNEYPSAQSLAGGSGNGRALSTAQYNSIANTLGVRVEVLTSKYGKFVPCWVGSTLCCTVNTNNECRPLDTDSEYILYMTRTAADVAANTERKYKALSSGCWYNLRPDETAAQSAYSSFLMMYNDTTVPSSDSWVISRVITGDRGLYSRGDWCRSNTYDNENYQ